MEKHIIRHSNFEVVTKTWGHEVIIANSSLYCGKKLVIKPGYGSSMHFHVKKTEHIYVGEGSLSLVLIENKIEKRHKLEAGDAVLVTPGLVHCLANASSTEDCVLYEFSTQHEDEDSYRIA